ncbi:MAG TPA: thioredoxin family protein [Burkholderiaceae bacterium]|nr:thioredoxin family protein [Burkholderiaceae bacterium]
MTSNAPLLVACFCAGWCQLCGSYRTTFQAAAERHPRHRFLFVDIEDQADLVHAIDVENFPTLLMAAGDQLRFLGVLTPQAETLERILRAAEADELPPPEHELEDEDLRELLRGLRELR